MRTLTALLLELVLVATAGGVPATPLDPDVAGGPEIDPALRTELQSVERIRAIVALRDDCGSDEAGRPSAGCEEGIAAVQEKVAAAVPDSDLHITHRYEHLPAMAGVITREGLHKLGQLQEVVAVGSDPDLELYLSSSVPYIGADRVRRSGITGKGQVVAVLDTGIDTDHLDLRDALKAQACFLTPESYCPAPPNVAEDNDGHGTHVAGIVASRGKRSSYGVAPGAEIVAIKLVEERNNAAGAGFAAALDWIIDRDDIDVVSMSFGSGAYEGYCDDENAYTKTLAAAFEKIVGKGIAVVAASGNDGSSTKLAAPACLRDVISVGAIEDGEGSDAQVAQFTNRNETLDLLAPGVSVEADFLSGRTASMGGTSQAAPHVAGAFALVREAVTWADTSTILSALKETGGRPTVRYGTLTISTIKVDAAIRELERNQPTVEPTAVPSDTPTPTLTASATPSASPTSTATASPAESQTPEPSATSSTGPSATATEVPEQTATGAATATPTQLGTATATPTLLMPVYIPVAYREE